MPGDIIEITPEPDPRSKSQPAAFAGQHPDIRAEIASQNTSRHCEAARQIIRAGLLWPSLRVQ
jgi:hypothetical protein